MTDTFRSYQEQLEILNSIHITDDTPKEDANAIRNFCEQIQNFDKKLQLSESLPIKEEPKVEEGTDKLQVRIELLTAKKNKILADIEKENQRQQEIKKNLIKNELHLIMTLRQIKNQFLNQNH